MNFSFSQRRKARKYNYPGHNKLVKVFHCVLRLCGVRLIFFTAAGPVLSFRLVTKTLSVTHQYFSCCWTALTQGLGCFSLWTQARRLRWAKAWHGAQLAQLAQRGMLHCITACSAIKLRWERIQKGLRDWPDISLVVVSDCFSITCGLVYSVVGVVFLIHLLNSLYANSWIFSLCPSILSPIPLGEGVSKQLCVA